MYKTNPLVNIYRHAHLTKYILEHLCVLKPTGGCTPWGKLLHLTEEEMRTKGLQIVLADLEEFESRDSDDGAETNGVTPGAKKARKMLRDYWSVWVATRPGPALEITPLLETGRDSAVEYPEGRAIIRLPCSSEKFFKTLNRAFDKCCVLGGR